MVHICALRRKAIFGLRWKVREKSEILVEKYADFEIMGSKKLGWLSTYPLMS